MTDAATSLDLSKIRVRPLVAKACLERFECGERDLNKFADKAYKWVGQKRHKIFAGHLEANAWGLGFYSLSFKLEDDRKLPKQHHDIYSGNGAPILYIDALAVRRGYQNQGLGKVMLLDALRRAHHVSKHVAFYGVGLRSLNDKTTKFYEKHGFGAIDDDANPTMVVPIWTLDDLFDPKG